MKEILKNAMKDFLQGMKEGLEEEFPFLSKENNANNIEIKEEDNTSFIYGYGDEIPSLHPKIYPLFLDWLNLGNKPRPLYENKKDINSKNSYPFYMIYEWGLTNPREFHEDLIKNSYLRKATIEECLNSFTVNELKNILKENSLPLNGRKKVLIERCLTIDNLEIYNKKQLYTLSDKAKTIIKDDEEYLYVYKFIKKYALNLFDFNEYEKVKKEISYTKPTYDEVILYILMNKVKNFEQINDINLLRASLLALYYLFNKKNNKKALICIINIIDIDLSGLRTFKDEKNNITIEINPIEVALDLAPGIVDNLKKFNFSDVEFALDNYLCTLNLPFRYFEKEKLKEIILKAYTKEKQVNFYDDYNEFAKEAPKLLGL